MRKQKTELNSIIGSDVVITGDVTAEKPILIQGSIYGNCDVDNDMVVGISGKVKGNITGKLVTVEGLVQGDIKSRHKVIITKTGRVYGDITTNLIEIDENGIFCGCCEMDNKESDDTDDLKIIDINKDDFDGTISKFKTVH